MHRAHLSPQRVFSSNRAGKDTIKLPGRDGGGSIYLVKVMIVASYLVGEGLTTHVPTRINSSPT